MTTRLVFRYAGVKPTEPWDRLHAMGRNANASAHTIYLALLGSLRQRVTARLAAGDSYAAATEVKRFICLLEQRTPFDERTSSVFQVARSLVVLGRPLPALDHVELRLSCLWTGGSVRKRMHNLNPRYEVMCLKAGSGYFVLVTWPDGFETQVHGFSDASEANAWIVERGPKWQQWAPERVRCLPTREPAETRQGAGV